MADQEFKDWFQQQLSAFLGFSAGLELVNYILECENAQEVKEHLSSLLDVNDENSRLFVDEILKRWTPPQQCEGILDDEMTVLPPQSMVVDTRGAEFLDKNQLMEGEKKGTSPFKPKNLKFVPLFTAQGKVKTDTVMLPGRHACQCLAQKHKLINNCVECGRIVCEQEGSGPCMFCGNLVCSPGDMEKISRESNKSQKLTDKLLSQTVPDYVEDVQEESLQKAIVHKERLLEYDKNCTKRTKVIDDESDHFSADNRWHTKKEKEALEKRDTELREKRFASRRDKKFTLDFAGRKVIEDTEDNCMYDNLDEVVQASSYDSEKNKENIKLLMKSHPLTDPRIDFDPLQFCHTGMDPSLLKYEEKESNNNLRLQDKEIQEMVDKGICLSMHQPWASLLVYGIKKLEGRSWYTPHRGRLWIASTAQVAEKEQIKHTEDQYRYLYYGEKLPFPKDYPEGALLGCVNLVDCSTNEDYFAKNPDVQEENDSQYLFICENPEQLSIKFTMKGKHKTYKLESHIHAAAKKCLVATT